MTSTLHRAQRGGRNTPLRDLASATLSPIAVVQANLMPPEVVARRRLRWLRRRLAFVLVATVLLVGLGYGLTRQQTGTSQDELASTQQQTAQYDAQLRKFDALLRLQSQTSALRGQLSTVMAGDVQWSSLLANFKTVAPAGVSVTQIAGKVVDPGAPAPAELDELNAQLPPNVKVIGAFELSGTGKDYRSVAAFADSLSKLKGFVGVKITQAQSAAGTTTFSMGIVLSSAVLGGRFSPKAGK